MEWVQLVSTMEETELPPSLIGKLVSVADRLRMRSLQNLPNLNRFLRFLSWISYGLATVSFTNKIIPTNPATNTAVSYPTDT